MEFEHILVNGLSLKEKNRKKAHFQRPTWEEYFMDITHLVAKRSTCLRRQVGAVLVKDPELGEDAIKPFKCTDPNIFHKISAADWEKAVEHARAKLKQTAIDDGIMNKTADEARAVLTTFLQSLGYASQIEFEDK